MAADQIYARSSIGIGDLPLGCRPAIRAARFLYADIGRQVGLNGFDSVSQRAVVPAFRKAQVIAGSFVARTHLNAIRYSPVLDEARFLIDAVSRTPARKNSDGTIAWLVDLFERLERQDQVRRGQSTEALFQQPRLHHYRVPQQAAQLQKLEC